MKRIILLSAVISALLLPTFASAYANTPSIDPAYNNRIVDDSIFLNSSAMTVQGIQSFLNSKVPVCDTNHQGGDPNQPPPYKCLRDYVDPTTGKTAAQLIYDEATSIGLNPQVILVTLQKEQSLVTDNWPYPSQYKSAMGYGCPESQTICDSQYYGFYNQVHLGARLLRAGVARNCGDTTTLPGWSINSKWARGQSPSVDGVNTFLATCSTGALMNYTPHRPDSAYTGRPAGCNPATPYPQAGYCTYYYGNYNFINFWSNWFGPTWTTGYSFISATNPPTVINPDQVVSTSITVRNDSGTTWYADGNLQAGQHPTRLTTVNYQATPYANTSDSAWLGTNNQVKMVEPTVAPGQNATFAFTMKGPTTPIDNYVTNFTITIDGVLGFKSIGMGFANRTPVNYIYSYVSASNPPSTILPGDRVSASITVKNTGNMAWYADGNVPAGKHPVRLAMIGYANTQFAPSNDSSWLGTRNQVKMVTPTVQPGENAVFNFSLAGPLTQTNSTIYFAPVIDGIAFMPNIGMGFKLTTPAPVYSYQFSSATNPPSSMALGQQVTASISVKNTGNVVWSNSANHPFPFGATRLILSRPLYHDTTFALSSDPGWLGTSNQIDMATSFVRPGEIGTFTFPWKANQSGSFVNYFTVGIDGYAIMQDIGMGFANQIP